MSYKPKFRVYFTHSQGSLRGSVAKNIGCIGKQLGEET